MQVDERREELVMDSDDFSVIYMGRGHADSLLKKGAYVIWTETARVNPVTPQLRKKLEKILKQLEDYRE